MYYDNIQTSNLIVNLDHDDWFLDDNKTLAESGVGKKNLFTYIYMLTVFIIVVINIFYYFFKNCIRKRN